MDRMTPERWRRVTALLDEVLACDPSRRETLLTGLCDGDPELRQEIESLLRFEEERVSVLEEPLARWHPSSGASSKKRWSF
jgi:eukaryotic-like serine/threonine-protein kinase